MASLAASSAPAKSTPTEINHSNDDAMPEPMDVDMTKQEETLKTTVAVANGKSSVGNATAAMTNNRSGESPAETARKMLERAKRRLEIQMQFVENARRKILDETHPDMAERLQVLDEERDRMLHVAEQRSEYFQNGTTVIFDYECEEANSEYDLHCEKLRQDMLEEIQHEMEILGDQRKGGHSFSRATTRKTRSTRNKNGSETSSGPFALDTAQKIKKRAGYVFQPLEKMLGQSEIDHDVRELTNFYEATKKRRMEFDTDGEAPLVAKYHRSKLLYQDWIFQEGDEVYVLNYTASSEYVAAICAVSSTEVIVLSEKGKYYRLVMNDLRQGRVVLTTLSAEQSNARDDGGDASP
ncbi:hypothetical protein BBJ29_004255 [Phytophthora kernoviae]|uniref:Uncharacterized protein n=1 Tax=Phytophthora kernoviae TaxID=325452 RepID=A0A3F2RME7_9STRA|nr:hypothetical protein BBP00_00005959 [Phytophthora kernoviae]RLN66486.1 hypothetical protein BBJ29_004255 [Phytophthora kernoviae]